MILVKRNKLTPYGDYRLQRINAGCEKSSPTGKALFGLGNGPGQNCMIGIGIGRYKPLGLQD